jgi:hypothetical protein
LADATCPSTPSTPLSGSGDESEMKIDSEHESETSTIVPSRTLSPAHSDSTEVTLDFTTCPTPAPPLVPRPRNPAPREPPLAPQLAELLRLRSLPPCVEYGHIHYSQRLTFRQPGSIHTPSARHGGDRYTPVCPGAVSSTQPGVIGAFQFPTSFARGE